MEARKKLILDIITSNFLENGTALGSPSIARKKEVDFSAATVRNIMNELQDEGYIKKRKNPFGSEPTEFGIMQFFILFPEKRKKISKFSFVEDFSEKEMRYFLRKFSEYSEAVTFAIGKDFFFCEGNIIKLVYASGNFKEELLSFFANEKNIEKICRDFLSEKENFVFANRHLKFLSNFAIAGAKTENVTVGAIILKNSNFEEIINGAQNIIKIIEAIFVLKYTKRLGNILGKIW